jgi:hypothetical protein
MTYKPLPAAITDFLDGLTAGDLDLATSRISLFAVGVENVTSHKGAEGVRALLESRPALGFGESWRVDYAMDTEFIVTGESGLQLQFLLEGGCISYLHISHPSAQSASQSTSLAA